MNKLERLLKRYVRASIAEYNKGGKMPEDYVEIEKELRVSGVALFRYLHQIEILALQRVEQQIENGNTDKIVVALRKDLSP